MLHLEAFNSPSRLIETKPLLDTFIIVKAEVGIVVLLAASFLAGCGSSSGSLLGNASGLAGNWQIQTSASAASASPQGVILMGALESSGNQVSGTFRFTNVAQPAACGSNQVVSLSGAIGPNNRLTLASATLPNRATIKISLILGQSRPYSGLGTVEVDGGSCAVASAPAIGSQVAAMTGNFSGTLSPGASGAPASGTPGTGTVTLTQSDNPDSDGRFTVAGTLKYQFGSCSGSVPLNGKVSGVGITFLDIIFTSGGGQEQANLVGTVDPAATQIDVGSLSLSPAPCSANPDSIATFSGRMNRK